CNRQGIRHVHLFTCPYNLDGYKSKHLLLVMMSFTTQRVFLHALIKLYFYFFQIVKERELRLPISPLIRKGSDWWRMTGSNRRPPACKAGALPAELIPQCLGGSGWARTNDPRVINTVL